MVLLLLACVPPSPPDDPWDPFGADSGAGDDTDDTDGADSDDTPDDTGDRPAETWLDVETPWVGDASCLADEWLVDEAGAGCVQEELAAFVVTDLFEGEPVGDASVTVGAEEGTTDSAGNATLLAPTCEPVTALVSTPPEWEMTVDTWTERAVHAYGEDTPLPSASETMARILPGLLGIEWDREDAVVSGKVYGCDGEPIENVQIRVLDAGGALPARASPFYFEDRGFPTDAQAATSAQGAWGAINVPDGDWIVEAWGWDGELVRLGEAPFTARAGAWTVVDVHVGHADGVRLPVTCTDPCE